MILAAGLGTRLLPLTERLPKALVEIGGSTLLERTVARLAGAGCDRIVINLHHHADRIVDFLKSASTAADGATGEAEAPYRWHGAAVLISREVVAPLDTGGGLKHARGLFRGDRTILVHNVDVVSSIDLARLAGTHEKSGALATLAVNRRSASRYLVFDGEGLCGRVDTRDESGEWARTPGEPHWRAGFTGIHALSPDILSRLTENGAFSIMLPYLRLVGEGAIILPFDVTGESWMDVGTPERLDAARVAWAEGAG
jgi:NDP-sugar pyrophosphorylase family protein